MTPEQFDQYRNKGKQILGYMPIKTPCATCQTPDEKIPKTSKLPSKKCLIRQCVDKAGIPNCAYCSRFSCDTLKATAGLWNRKSIEAKLGAPLSEQDYHSFIEPFEGLNRLTNIRYSLNPDQIVEPPKATISAIKIVDFPDSMLFKEGTLSFKAVHNLLAAIEDSSLGLKNTDTFAQQHKLERQKAHILRFLWIMGNYGKLEESTRHIVDAETYQSNRRQQKNLSILSFVKEVIFKALADFGICCKLVALNGVKVEDLTTGTGYLRKRGWIMKISFEEKIGGTATIKALQTFAHRLDQKYSTRAFQHFRQADMTVMLD